MDDSILSSVKKMLGIENDFTAFDDELIMYINGALMTLNQLGVGVEGYIVDDSSSSWSEFLGSETTALESVKTVVYLRVKKVFDPPASSSTQQALDAVLQEYEWRLYVATNRSNDTEDAT